MKYMKRTDKNNNALQKNICKRKKTDEDDETKGNTATKNATVVVSDT